MNKEAALGNMIHQANIENGHDLLYKADLAYVEQNEQYLRDGGWFSIREVR